MHARERIIALIVACALFMQSVDSTILGTALATIAGSFDSDPVRLHTAMTSYLLSLAIFMPMSGWMADRYGTRAIFRLAVLLFVLASIGCALARSLETLVAARIVQGIGGAMMIPVARLALLRSVPKKELINAMAWVSIPAMIGPLIGPPLGGFIVTYASWPWIFLINIPIGIATIALATIYMPDLREAEVAPFDVVGFILMAVGIAGLVVGFATVGDGILPLWVNLAAALVGAACLALYVGHARRTASPILALALLQVQTFFSGVVGGFLFRTGVGAIPFLVPLMLQAGFGFSPQATGLTMIAAAAGAFLMKFGVQRIITRLGFRWTLMSSAILSAIFVSVFALFTARTPILIMMTVLFIGGFFRSMQFTALNAIAYADLDQRQMSQATAFASMAQQLALAVGVGIAALVIHALRLAGMDEANAYLAALAGVGLLLGSSVLIFARLSPDAGAELARRPIAAVGGAARPPSDTRV